MPPFSFSDSELGTLMSLATPIHPSRRGEYLEAVALMLAQYPERGDGLAFRIGRELQPRFMHAPPRLNGGVARSRRRSGPDQPDKRSPF
jgi:hypothetical protein